VAMSDPITGKVAAIENNYSVVINRGATHHVKKGMVFVIEDPQGKEVRDPDNPDEILDYLPVEKIKVKVFEVREKICRAETYIRVKPETPYETAARELMSEYRNLRDFPSINQMGYPFRSSPEAQAKLQQALHFLQMGAVERSSDERPAVVEVNVGDIARQIG
jgi:hypothetical protein